VVSTRKSFVFRISVTISAGRATPNVSPFTTSRGMFSRASPVIFANEDDRNGVVSIALKGNELFLLAWRVLQRWSLSQDNQKVSFSSQPRQGSSSCVVGAGVRYRRPHWRRSIW
jgi:hypothetical protein